MKIDKWDCNAVKNALDDASKKVTVNVKRLSLENSPYPIFKIFNCLINLKVHGQRPKIEISLII